MIENASIALRQNYNFDAFSTLHTKTFENDRIARSDVSWTLCAGYKDMRLRYFRSSFSFWRVFDRFRPSTLIRYECVFKVTHFQERFQIDAFSMKTISVLVWTESLNVSNVCVLKENALVWRGLTFNTYTSGIRLNLLRADLFLFSFTMMSRFHWRDRTTSRHHSPSGGNEWANDSVGKKLRPDGGRFRSLKPMYWSLENLKRMIINRARKWLMS